MTLTRALTMAVAAAAMLASPILQDAAFAQGRRGGREAGAQRRAVRVAPAPRRGRVVVGAYYRPVYISPFYDPFYDPFYYPYYYPAFGYRYGPYPRYGYSQAYVPESALRLQVSPRNTEVFVDGYYAGVVDDFDGTFHAVPRRISNSDGKGVLAAGPYVPDQTFDAAAAAR
jgi:hypothetical protein